MRQQFKRIISLLLLAAILTSALPVNVLAANETAAETAETWFVFDQDTNTITSYSQDVEHAPKDVVIPSTINGVEVKSIGAGAFKARVDITGVVIPDTVTTIDGSAFDGCTNLRSVKLGNGVTSISGYAFSRCSSLTDVQFPDGLVAIGGSAFWNCSKLTGVVLPASVEKIGQRAFSGCSSLTDMRLPSGVTLGDAAFERCTGLTTVTLPDDITEIPQDAFSECTSLKSITLPDSIVKIGQSAFFDCSSLTAITIPEPITNIGRGVFKKCTSLTSVSLPNGLEIIGDNAFYECDKLTSITIPNGVSTIGKRAFYGTSLENVKIPDSVTSIGEDAFSSSRGGYVKGPITINRPRGSISGEPWGAPPVCAIYWSDTVVLGGKYLCQVNGDGLELVRTLDGDITDATDIQDLLNQYNNDHGTNHSITSIGSDAFVSCKKLSAISIPDSVTNIGEGAFWDCENLAAITIPESVTAIGEYAFSDTTTVTVKKAVDSIEGAPWGAGRVIWNDTVILGNKYLCQNDGNGKLVVQEVLDRSITSASDMQDLLDAYNASNGTNYSFSGIADEAFVGCQSLVDVKIPEGVTSIGTGAFFNCENLTSVTFPSSLTSIGASAFKQCWKLTSVDIPDGVTSISGYAFQDCHELTSVKIPSSVKSIGEGAFLGCKTLTSIKIPDGVVSIGDSAFFSCVLLNDIEIAKSVTTIGESAFAKTLGPVRIDKPTNSIAGAPWGTTGAIIWNDSLIIGDKYVCEETDDGNLTVVGCLAKIPYVYATNNIPPSYPEKKFFTATDMQSLLDAYNAANGKNYVITAIGDGLFEDGCVTDVKIPESVTSIGANAFSSTTLTEISIPDGVTSIGEGAFSYNSDLSTVKLPENLTCIEERLFQGCGELTSVNIPDGVTSIGSSAFEYCSSLTDVKIPPSTTYIGESTFENCSSITEVEIPGSVQYIYSSTFKNCTGLKRVTILDGVKKIEGRAFYNCKGLESLTIPNSVTEIGYYAFSPTPNLKGEVTVSGHCQVDSKAFYGYSLPLLNIRSARAVYKWLGAHPYSLSDDRVKYIGDVPTITAKAIRNEDGSYLAGVHVTFVGDNGSISDGVVRVQFPRDNGKGENPPQGETFQVATGGVAEWDSISNGYGFRVSEAGKYYMRVCGLTQDQANRDSWPICEFVIGTPEISAKDTVITEAVRDGLQTTEDLITLVNATAKDDFDTNLTRYIQTDETDLAAVKALKEDESVQVTLKIKHPDTDLVAEKTVTVSMGTRYTVTYKQPTGYVGGDVISKRMDQGSGYTILDVAAVSSAAQQNGAAEWHTPADERFIRWKDADGNYYAPGTEIKMTSNLVLTAEYAKSTVEVTFRVVNGTWEDGSTTKVVTVALSNGSGPLNVPTGTANSGYSGGSWAPAVPSSVWNSGDSTIYTLTYAKKSSGGGGSGSGSGSSKPAALNSEDHIAYVVGFSDGTVRPEANISRAQFATMLYRLLRAERRDQVFTSQNAFSDVTRDLWYNKAVSSMANGGYIKGYSDGMFRGNQNITRAEFVAMLVRFIGVNEKAYANFVDVSKDYWAYQYIATATEAGWIQGYQDNTYRPDQDITRAEAMVIMNRVLERGVDSKSKMPSGIVKWPDNDPSAWYYYDVVEATNDHAYTGKRPSENWNGLKIDYVYDIAKYEHP